jgi:hypothetical protein
MMIARHRSSGTKKRRTTLTLPVDSLAQAERIAGARKMLDPGSGPFRFHSSAESGLIRTDRNWMREYLSRHQVHTSAVTVLEGCEEGRQ